MLLDTERRFWRWQLGGSTRRSVYVPDQRKVP